MQTCFKGDGIEGIKTFLDVRDVVIFLSPFFVKRRFFFEFFTLFKLKSN